MSKQTFSVALQHHIQHHICLSIVGKREHPDVDNRDAVVVVVVACVIAVGEVASNCNFWSCRAWLLSSSDEMECSGDGIFT